MSGMTSNDEVPRRTGGWFTTESIPEGLSSRGRTSVSFPECLRDTRGNIRVLGSTCRLKCTGREASNG
jgi:hypothetical protein